MTATEEKLDNLDLEKFKNLIEELTAKRQEIESRYDYNVFKALKLETDETRLHSAFLADLLNPKGSHREGNIFLKLFLETICKFDDVDEKLEDTVKVVTEVSIGNISKDKKEGGRLDLQVKGKSFIIVIENKIYAEDQIYQLLRYHNYLKKKQNFSSENKKLFYLTLLGSKASKISTGGKEVDGEEADYEAISYREHILPWIEKCLNECKKDRVKTVLQQYSETVEGLINPASAIIKIIRENTMDEFFLDTDYLRTVKIIHQSFDKISKEIIFNIINKITENMGTVSDKSNVRDIKNTNPKEYIRVIKINDVFSILFKYSGTLYYGITSIDKSIANLKALKEILPAEIISHFDEQGDKHNSDFLFKKKTTISLHDVKLCDDIYKEIKEIAEKCKECIEIIKTLANPPIAESVKKIV